METVQLINLIIDFLNYILFIYRLFYNISFQNKYMLNMCWRPNTQGVLKCSCFFSPNQPS